MPVTNDALLDESLRCLQAHLHPKWGDRHPLDVFNRLLAKNILSSTRTRNTHLDIKCDQVSSRREQWTTEDLGKLARGHKSAAAKTSAARSSLQNMKAYNACSMEIIASTVGLLPEICEFTTSTFTRSQGLASSLNFLLSQIEPNNTFKRTAQGHAPLGSRRGLM